MGGRSEQRRRLVGPWRSIHAALWLVGLFILIQEGSIWPGILILIVLSLIFEAILMRMAPQAFEDDREPVPAPAPAAAIPVAPPPVPEHRVDLLPLACPKCGAPVRGHEVRWTGSQSADCMYCGANLPMEKA